MRVNTNRKDSAAELCSTDPPRAPAGSSGLRKCLQVPIPLKRSILEFHAMFTSNQKRPAHVRESYFDLHFSNIHAP